MNTRPLSSDRIIVVPNEVPVPFNSGGRVDVWRRLAVLKSQGATLGLLTWYDGPRDGPPSQAQLDALAPVCGDLHLGCISRGPDELLHRLWYTGRLPSHAASRWVTIDQSAALSWARKFQPTLLLADGLYGAAVVQWLSGQLGVPYIYRSHNIEHRYMAMQLAQAKGAKKRLGLLANMAGLERFERCVVAGARMVLDISASDMQYWQAQGVQNIRWLPPIVDAEFTGALAAAAGSRQSFDALYFGNLNTPNNVEAVRWFVTQVLPRLPDSNLRFAVAGSRPSQQVSELLATEKRVQLIENPPDMAAVVALAKVLVNPVQGGSGVNLKSVEMLFSDAQLLSTSTGVQGLPAEVGNCFRVADDPAEFAAMLDDLWRASQVAGPELGRRDIARQVFTPAAAGGVLADVVRATHHQG